MRRRTVAPVLDLSTRIRDAGDGDDDDAESSRRPALNWATRGPPSLRQGRAGVLAQGHAPFRDYPAGRLAREGAHSRVVTHDRSPLDWRAEEALQRATLRLYCRHLSARRAGFFAYLS